MKILHVIPSVSPQRGGPSAAVRAMAQTMAVRGADVHIATTDDDNQGHLAVPLNRPVVEQGVTFHYFQRQTNFYAFSWPLTKWLWENIAAFDLLHIHSLFSYSTLPATRMARLRRVPYIIRPLGQLNRWGLVHRRARLKKLSLQLVEYPALRHAQVIHYASEQEQLEAQQLGIHNRAQVVPLSTDVEALAHLPSTAPLLTQYPQLRDKVRILFLARLDEIKGIDLLLQAFALVHHKYPNLALLIAGSGDEAYEAALRLQAAALGIAAHVTWLGFADSQTKKLALAAADIFVLPSYFESFGIAVVEAMAAGIPVIVSDQVGLYREVEKFAAGLVTSCHAETLADQMTVFVTDAELRAQMGRNGQQLAQERFSLEAMGNGLMQLYQQVLYESTKAGDPNPLSIQRPIASKK